LPSDPIGYAGEKTCHICGKGGYGEPDEPDMFLKRVLREQESELSNVPKFQ
jgi:hypothetical protein